MRKTRLLLPLLAALAVAACARQQQAYYVIDPQTGQPVPVVSQQTAAQLQYPQTPYAQQPQYAPQPAPAPTADSSRGLFSRSPAYAQQAYAQPAYPAPQTQAYAQPEPPPQPSNTGSGRGLFSSRSSAPVYAQPTYPQAAAPQYAAPQYAVPQTGGPYTAAPYGYAAASPAYSPSYTLDSGDKLRIVVFGQEGISNSYTVDAGGNVNLPLVGTIPARGATTQQLSRLISERLKQGYVREPHVSVEVETYRPFFILGEVNAPGQYPYVANMTAETAVAIAGGFSPRASKKTVQLTRNAPGQQIHGDVPLSYQLRPGDTVVVKERWF